MKYTITARAARLASGVLALTAAQAKPRLHNLAALGGGRYEIVKPVEFKNGEEIGYEGDLPKALATFMEDEDSKRDRIAAEEKAATAATEKVSTRKKTKAEQKAEADQAAADADAGAGADADNQAG